MEADSQMEEMHQCIRNNRNKIIEKVVHTKEMESRSIQEKEDIKQYEKNIKYLEEQLEEKKRLKKRLEENVTVREALIEENWEAVAEFVDNIKELERKINKLDETINEGW